jgi:hypothetical protein
MTPRSSLTSIAAVLAAVALPVLAQTAPQNPAPADSATQAFAVPPHNCVAPQYPSKDASVKESTTTLKGSESQQKSMEAYNRAVEAFNRDAKAYETCIKKYVADTKTWMQAVADAGNKAVDEYNKYTAELRAKVEAEK